MPWLIPVRFDDCNVPDWDIGAGRTLRSLQYADLFGDRREAELARLVAFVRDAVSRQAATGMFSPPKRRLPGRPPRIAVTAAVLAVAAGLIAAVLAASDGPGPGRGSLIVRGRPWATTRGGTVRTELAVGNTVRYAFEVDNSTGRRVNANVRFDAYWGTRDEPPVNIFNLLFSRTIPPGISTVYSPRTRVPPGALPGMYTEQADISDRNYPADRTGQYGAFAVTGRKLLAVPFLPLSGAIKQFAVADGPACVAMVLGSYPGARRPTVLGVRDFIAGSSRDRDPAAGEALEYALEHFGVPDGAISQISLGESGLPQAQVTAMAIAIRHGSPVIAFVDAADLPASGARRLSGTGRWIVVAGFEFSATSGTEVLVDDPGAGAGPRRARLSPWTSPRSGGRLRVPRACLPRSRNPVTSRASSWPLAVASRSANCGSCGPRTTRKAGQSDPAGSPPGMRAARGGGELAGGAGSPGISARLTATMAHRCCSAGAGSRNDGPSLRESAGINRHGGGDGRALRRRASVPRRPSAMRRRPARAWRSVGMGTCRPGY